MVTKNSSTTLSPARIYVLWHPDFDRPDLKSRDPATLTEAEKTAIDRGLRLARQIYYWFRLENMEGIPVYFRSTNALGKSHPLPIDRDCRINYVIALIDDSMVSSPDWRDYVSKLAVQSGKSTKGCVTQLLPVAVNPVAYNMPESMRRINYIRHDLSRTPAPDDGALISQLTEVLCRDMRVRVKNTGKNGSHTVPGKLKIFLSHAKADDTREAIELKNYIQGQTQCEAFFDETDIASGYDYSNVLETAITEDSAGLIVIQGDHYADRPWCRKEIRDFLKPVSDRMVSLGSAPAYFVPPVIVVQTMQGNQIARTIPELGHAPCVRWQDDKARFIVRTLLREILLGLFYRLVGHSIVKNADAGCVLINRTPDPVMVNRILSEFSGKKPPLPVTLLHPGYGLSSMEHEGLKMSFPDIEFRSFSEVSVKESLVPLSACRAAAQPPPLEGRVLSVSAGNANDALDHGIGDEHNQELLIRLLRPLLRKQVSLLYGGTLPNAVQPAEPWREPLNFTGAFLHLLLSERSGKRAGQAASSRLYNLCSWPDNLRITRQIIAQWTDICSFIPLAPMEAGCQCPPPKPLPAADAADQDTTPAERRKLREDHVKALAAHQTMELATRARCLSHMRFMACRPIRCVLPDKPAKGPRQVTVQPFAHIFAGGKTMHAAGIIPGVFEEILHALEAQRPVFILGQSCGAAGLVARWFSGWNSKDAPRELRPGHYLRPDQTENNFQRIRNELLKLEAPVLGPTAKKPENCVLTPDEALERLWEMIKKARMAKDLEPVFRNGLNHEENMALLTSRSCAEACRLVWEGIDRLQTPTPIKNASPSTPSPRSGPKP